MFTDAELKALPTRDGAYRVYDGGSDPGFCVVIRPSGRKYFYLRYRFDSRERLFKLGEFRPKGRGEKEGSLARARVACRQAQALLDLNIDPQADREEKLEAARRAEEERKREEASGSVKDLFEKYTDHLEAAGKRSVEHVRQLWAKDIKPVIGSMKAKDVQPGDIKRVLGPIIKRGKMIQANRCRSYLMAAFRFGIEWENDAANYDVETVFGIERNPVRDVPKPQKSEPPGERVLTEDEIRDHWQGWGDTKLISIAAGSVLKLILATGGQRVEEVLRASWDEFNTKDMLWEIPPSRTKSGRPHVVPLTKLALEALKEAKPLSGGKGLVFPQIKEPEIPIQTNSVGKAVRAYCDRYQKVRTKALIEAGELQPGQQAELEPFTARDLRRTVKTLMGKMGISKEIRDRLQNHALTDVSSKHYDRYDYLKEREQVMRRWERKMRAILKGEIKSNVVQLPAS